MQDTYIPIDCGFHDILLHYATKRMYAKIHYYTEIGEILIVMALIKDIYTEKGQEFMLLATGERIRLDRIIALDNYVAPNHSGYLDFSCDC